MKTAGKMDICKFQLSFLLTRSRDDYEHSLVKYPTTLQSISGGVIVKLSSLTNKITYVYEIRRMPQTWKGFLFCFNLSSSGSIVSDYGLDDRAIGVRSPAGAKDFSSSLCVQTGSGAHPASCTMGTGDSFPGGKARSGRDADHSPLSSAEVVNE
jgi:hypothetical protein